MKYAERPGFEAAVSERGPEAAVIWAYMRGAADCQLEISRRIRTEAGFVEDSGFAGALALLESIVTRTPFPVWARFTPERDEATAAAARALGGPVAK